jgi:type I restriction enzyme, S subunit
MSFNDYQDTLLGLLPQDWRVMALKEVVEKTKQKDLRKYPNNMFRYIDVASVSNETYRIMGWNDILGKNAPSRARKVVEEKDTIFATVRPYLRNIAQIPKSLDGEICSTGFCVIRANRNLIDPDFLYFVALTNTFVDTIVAKQRGSSYPAVSDKVIFDTIIPLPPLIEQHSIDHVLSTVRKSLEATQHIISAARQLKRSLMNYLFTYGPVPIDQADQVVLKETEIGEVPKKWEIKSAQSIFPRVTDGLHNTPPRLSNGIPLVTSKLIRNGKIRFDWADYFISVEEHKAGFDRSGVSAWDVIFSMIGTLGEAAIVSPDYPEFSIKNAGLFKTGGNRQLAEFSYFWFSSEKSQKYFKGKSSGSIQKYVPLGFLRQYPIPMPTSLEQENITKSIRAIDEKIATEEAHKAALEVLFNTFLNHLITGKVRVKS